MSFLRLVLRSLIYHWRVNLAAAAAVAAGTAVLTGALMVGDSMRSSLRRLMLERLGRIDEALVAERFFRAELADELAAQPGFSRYFTEVVPAILLRGSVAAELEIEQQWPSAGPLVPGRAYTWECPLPGSGQMLEATLRATARGAFGSNQPQAVLAIGQLNIELFGAGADPGTGTHPGNVIGTYSDTAAQGEGAVAPRNRSAGSVTGAFSDPAARAKQPAGASQRQDQPAGASQRQGQPAAPLLLHHTAKRGARQCTATLVLPASTIERLALAGRLPWRLRVDAGAERIEALEMRLTLRVGVQANQVQVIGCDERFWKLGSGRPASLPAGDRVVVNRALAERLGVRIGEAGWGVGPGSRLIVRLPQPSAIPAETALGRKQQTVRAAPFVLGEVIPAEGLGRFGLRPTQHLPLCVFVSLGRLQERLEQPGRVNALLVAGRSADAPLPGAHEALGSLFAPRLEDLGISVCQTEQGYFNITSDRMLLSPPAEKAVFDALGGLRAQPALTYLANTLTCGGRTIPYSTVTAIELADQGPLGPLVDLEGRPIDPLAADEIVLNQWAAEQLEAKPGDRIELSYFEPETVRARFVERTAQFTLAAVARLEGAAADPHFTPDVPGVTDRLAMGDWDPPFPFDARRIRRADEQYWEQYRATPKAFVALQTGRSLWGSRFGRTTSIRVPRQQGVSLDALRSRLRLDPAAFGLMFQPVKQQGLEASRGTTSFSALFLAFSFFVIVAAVMLVGLLYVLAVEQRASQVGILLAGGWPRQRAGRLLIAEGLLVGLAGSFLGVGAGVGYAALLLWGLRTWWLAAVVTRFLRLAFPPSFATMATGMFGGLAAGLLAMWLALRRAARYPPRRLLAGQTGEQGGPVRPATAKVRWAWLGSAAAVLLTAAAMGFWALRLGEQAQAGAFFGAGALVLAASLVAVWAALRFGMTGPAVAAGRGNLLRLALRNMARIPLRSTLTVGLVASAVFLIISVSAFRLDPRHQVPRRESGNGGFALLGQSDQPIYHDLATDAGRAELGFSPADRELLAACRIIALRAEAGEDASCLNLYRPRQPRVLGVPRELLSRGGFAFADHLPFDGPSAEAGGAQTRAAGAGKGAGDTQPRAANAAGSSAGKANGSNRPAANPNPWLLLDRHLPPGADGTPRVPVILEKNTANYSLHLWQGVGQTFEISDGRGQPLRLVIVGLLGTSIFQGDLLIGEEAFQEHFPQAGGYRVFLVECPPEKIPAVRSALERNLADYGFGTQTTGDRLAELLAVQNTYLSTFQSLGGLGLLLGTFGLCAVQLRNVFQRRGELALLRAAGFPRATLGRMVLIENILLLGAGLGAGILPAVVAVLPHLFGRGAGIPFGALAVMLGLVLLVGLAAGSLAVRAVLRGPLLAALREEK